MTGTPRVLVLGHRQGLEHALAARGIPFALWVDRPLRKTPAVPHVVAPFPITKSAVARAMEGLEGPFTHVIAAVEAAVPAASYARRVFDARASKHTVAMRCSDKLFMKKQLRGAGVAVTDFADLATEEGRAAADELGAPLVVKDRRSSGSRGVEVVSSLADVDAAPHKRRMAERLVHGTEMSVESFVVDGEVRFVSTTRYAIPKHVNVVPAALEPTVQAQVEATNAAALRALGIRWGMTHLELFLTEEGPVVGEVALRPPGGYIMTLLEMAWGFDPWDALVVVELDLDDHFPTAPNAFAAAVIFHPGEGELVGVEGADEVRAMEACQRLSLKLKPGEHVPPRVGVGIDVGYALLKAADAQAIEAAWQAVAETLKFDVRATAEG